MAIIRKHSNEMSTLYLVKSYCLLALLYGCEVWHQNDSNMQKNSGVELLFQTFFSCCWRESVKPLGYNISDTYCQYHIYYICANYSSAKSCIALTMLFYSHYLVASIRLLSLRVVCIMCYRWNCQTTQPENWFGIHLPCLWTCDFCHITSLFLCFVFLYSCGYYCLYNCMFNGHLA